MMAAAARRGMGVRTDAGKSHSAAQIKALNDAVGGDAGLAHHSAQQARAARTGGTYKADGRLGEIVKGMR